MLAGLYGCQPEIGSDAWCKDMKEKVASFAPTENRMCCFSTSSDSWHGNPEPVNHPDGLPRQSIALYYYSNGRPEEEIAETYRYEPLYQQ